MAQADWLVERMVDFGGVVSSVVPVGFESYARIFHPIAHGPERRWADLARRNGRIAHPEMQYHLIRSRPGERPVDGEYEDGFEDFEDAPGSMPRDLVCTVADLLAPHTDTPDSCWFAAWEGWGQMQGGSAWTRMSADDGEQLSGLCPPEILSGPGVVLPGRRYVLLHGTLAQAGACHDLLGDQSPSLWWPADRTWIVATEVDFAWSYVGGSAEVIGALLAATGLEVLPARLSDGIHYDSDLLNADVETARGPLG